MPTAANVAKGENGKNTIVEVWTYDLFELGGTYTLWIEDLHNTDGKYLKENVKMEFTISDFSGLDYFPIDNMYYDQKSPFTVYCKLWLLDT
ncbi:hypothetical protein SporoP37_12300 [Sporosarcina sp. P37]|nr:hypothetical protein SporoP37_12300 [Sporosarcina sp. P37]PID19087.1 hypothetical protein CSV62_05670 [Sporosarcina sp. P35]